MPRWRPMFRVARRRCAWRCMRCVPWRWWSGLPTRRFASRRSAVSAGIGVLRWRSGRTGIGAGRWRYGRTGIATGNRLSAVGAVVRRRISFCVRRPRPVGTGDCLLLTRTGRIERPFAGGALARRSVRRAKSRCGRSTGAGIGR